MSWFMLFVILVYSCLVDSEHLNYCNTKVCPFGDEHTFCQFRTGPGTSCKGYMPVPLSREDQLTIVAKFNKRRSDSAKEEPQASNIMKMYWVDSLAAEAQLWADQCRPATIPEEHDVCRNLYSVQVGQCVGSVVGNAPGLRPGSFVDMWLLRSLRNKADLTSGKANPNCDDFVQIFAANSYMVGCGRSQFQSQHHGRLQTVQRLVCNFAPRGLLAGKSLWSVGPPATDCPNGARPDEDYPALCSYGQTSREIEEELNKREYRSALTNSKKVRRFLSEPAIAKTEVSETSTNLMNITTNEKVTKVSPSNSSQKNLTFYTTKSATEPTEINATEIEKALSNTETVANKIYDFKTSLSRLGNETNKSNVDGNKNLAPRNRTTTNENQTDLELTENINESKDFNEASVLFNDTVGKIEMILRYATSRDFRFNKSSSFSFCIVLHIVSYCTVIFMQSLLFV